jgi:hypothetical protein
MPALDQRLGARPSERIGRCPRSRSLAPPSLQGINERHASQKHTLILSSCAQAQVLSHCAYSYLGTTTQYRGHTNAGHGTAGNEPRSSALIFSNMQSTKVARIDSSVVTLKTCDRHAILLT